MTRVPGGWRRLLREVPFALSRWLSRGGISATAAATVARGTPPWRQWRHVVKLDPDRQLPEAVLRLVLGCGTDAIVVGGTQDITAPKVLNLLERLRGSTCPVALEVSDPAAAVPGVDMYFVPLVINAGDTRWITGAHGATLADLLPGFAPLIPWERMWPAAYLVQNPESAVATRTAAAPATLALATGYAALIGRIWRLPLLYIEYSGTFGDPSLVAAARQAAGPGCRIWYGGGIQSATQAESVAHAAHTVVVGNMVYRSPEDLAATVRAVRAVPVPP